MSADISFIREVMRDPRVWRAVAEDGIDRDTFQPDPSAHYFQHAKGFLMFRQVSTCMYEIHIAMLRGARDVDRFVAESMQAMRDRGAEKFLATIPEWNRASIAIARTDWLQERRVRRRCLSARWQVTRNDFDGVAMSFITKTVGGILGSVTGSTQADAAKDAGNTQAAAANQAAQVAQQQYQQTRSDLQPYRDLGSSLVPALQDSLVNPWLGAQFSYGDYQAPAAFTAPTQSEAEATPGYQFTLQQGLKAAQNSASARGLGSSGAALKGASTYANGLADSTYNDVYNRALQTYDTNANNALTSYTTNRNNALSNFTTNYGVASDATNRLLGLVNLGQNSAAMTGNLGAQTASTVGNDITSGAAAQAAGTVGAANAYGGALNNALSLGTTLYGINTIGAKK
ncbi:hypothetical protein [Caballeronia sp. LZ001]|uniref:hypothetical protein n=1 Tax=Caballeronia sp. LZ001 TaxID=3038553 RepID=UPI0028545D80|nr:hypothetical protein [Caballeronia sp. LZ001]MDR5802131.1 hypothetical protein [Caballeronia sp. LZ001]